MTNEPTMGEIVRLLSETRDDPYDLWATKSHRCQLAIDRLESQEAKLKLLYGGDFDVIDIPAALAYLESVEEVLPHASALIDLIQSLHGSAKELTARAESAERERDAAKADMKFLDRCKTCFHAKTRHLLGSKCKSCKALSNFKWRGLPQEGDSHDNTQAET